MSLGTAVVCCNSSCRAVTIPLVTSAVVGVLTQPTTSWPCISTASVFVPPTSIPCAVASGFSYDVMRMPGGRQVSVDGYLRSALPVGEGEVWQHDELWA